MIKIDGCTISQGFKPLIVAEISGNHNRSLHRALSIVDAAARAGVNAIKIQTYTADTMTLDLNTDDFTILGTESLWKGKTLYELYKEAHTPWEWHEPIFGRAREHGLIAFSTPFDHTAVDFLEEHDVPCYKIASFEVTDIPLIKKVAATKKPLLISTGMATVAELDEAVQTAKEAGAQDIILLKCSSTYPASAENTNLLTIPHLKDLFSCEVGLSDHTLGVGVAIGSVALGATVIEKHFTLSRNDGGVDSAFSMEPDEMKMLVEESARVWQALGKISYGPTPQELKSKEYRRSLYITEDLCAGDKLTKKNLRAIRPGHGLSPKYFGVVLGKRIKKDVPRGTPFNWELLD